MRRILVVTGTRAEYGLLKKLMLELQESQDFELHVAVTGTHLSQKHGMTLEIIKADRLVNLHEVDLRIEDDSATAICDGIAHGLNGFSRLLTTLKPELMIILGDRYELMAAALSATVCNVPMAHIHGGESTEGAIDEAIRHSLTKMSHLHFCSHEIYRERIIRMGEDPKRVWNVGAVGLDRIREMSFLSRGELEARLNVKFDKNNVLCTFHPVTLDENQSASEMHNLICAIEESLLKSSVTYFITLPNADTFSGLIRKAWDELIKKHPTRVFGFVNLGDLLYLSLMKEVDVILGNSSSGILEAPYLGKIVIDVGRRQAGRLRSSNILHADGSLENLRKTLENALSGDFRKGLVKENSIYGEGHATEKIMDVLRNVDLKGILFKKFYDGPEFNGGLI